MVCYYILVEWCGPAYIWTVWFGNSKLTEWCALVKTLSGSLSYILGVWYLSI